MILAPIPPSDPRIVYVGRFDWTDKAAPACEWSASEVRLRVHGPTLLATIDDTNGAAWEKEIDGKDEGLVPLKKGEDTYTIDLGSDSDHVVRLVRRTEAFMGPTKIKGFETPNGRLLKARPKRRHLEFVGDSITCAYGNEGKRKEEHFKPETENAYMSYASIAARDVDADVTIIAWSGRKMWPDNTTPSIYNKILPNLPGGPDYDFKGPKPDGVIINLATNDFGRGAPDEAGWTSAYEGFIKRVWSHYPKAQIYATTGSMMFGANLATLKTYIEKIKSDLHDPRLHSLDFGTQDPNDGYGADWHPNITTDEKMGAKLAEALKHDLGW
ncbi:MAG TPA: GDSL-type esterase/lipase family protein [Fimbriimonas sp.]|nr:GDSL-type esterase/lipase family protein [Fimbriimonas sp.]